MNYFCCNWDSPVGKLKLTATENALTGIYFNAETFYPEINPVLLQTVDWLEKYFAGEKISPDILELSPSGTDFQHKVWDILLKIPYGEIITYGKIAKMLSPTMSAQAVGNAVGANPIPIIIPCHRVVAANGIGGYSDGISIKKQLLAVENIHCFR